MMLGMDFEQMRQRIKLARQATGTQENVAAEMRRVGGPTTRTLARWEAGENDPEIPGIVALCKVTGVTSDWILGLSDEGGPPVPEKAREKGQAAIGTADEGVRRSHEETPQPDPESPRRKRGNGGSQGSQRGGQ